MVIFNSQIEIIRVIVNINGCSLFVSPECKGFSIDRTCFIDITRKFFIYRNLKHAFILKRHVGVWY